MSENKENRSRRLIVRLKEDEFEDVEKRFKKTMFRKLSEYTRNVLLEKQVTVFYRDKAMDELLEEMVQLRKELNAVGNNLNQAMHLINSRHGQAEAKLWLQLLGVINSKVEPSIEQIKERINQYAELWSQKLKQEKA